MSLSPEAFRLVESNIAAVTRYAVSKARAQSAQYAEDDYIQDAREGLLIAASRYDASKGPFAAFFWVRVKGSIIDGVRNLSGRSFVERAFRNTDSLQRSLSACDGDHLTLSDTICDPVDGFQVIFDRIDQEEASYRLALMPARTQEIVRLRNIEGITWKAIGARFGVSESRACRIGKRAIRELRRHVESLDAL